MESLHHTHNKRPSAAWFSQKNTVAVVLESLPAREKQVGQKCIENLPREVRRARPVLPWLRIPCTSLFGLVCVVAACLQCSWCVGVCAATANQLCWLHRGPALLERGAVLHRKFAERSPPSKARSFLADRSLVRGITACLQCSWCVGVGFATENGFLGCRRCALLESCQEEKQQLTPVRI